MTDSRIPAVWTPIALQDEHHHWIQIDEAPIGLDAARRAEADGRLLMAIRPVVIEGVRVWQTVVKAAKAAQAAPTPRRPGQTRRWE